MTILRHRGFRGAKSTPEDKGLLSFLTDFADQAVILPVAAIVFLALASWREGRLALAWVASVCIGLGLVAVFKLLAFACVKPWAAIDLRSPSGHVASALCVYGGITLLCLGRRPGAWGVALALGVLVALTRIGLGVHTPADTIAGGAVGCVALGVFAALARGRPRRASWVVAMAAAAAAGLHGAHVSAEPALHRIVPQIWPFTLCL